ncbi:MAG: Bax inhibitor-1/YccA family protein, partial [Vicinamibacterales bacterium]
MTWRSANPAFGTDAFRGARVRDTTGAMTVVGTVNKTALSLLILAVTAGYVWNRGVTDPYVGTFTMAGVFGGLIVALATVFK